MKMKTAVIFGAGQMGFASAKLLNKNNIDLIAFGDNDEKKLGVRFDGFTCSPCDSDRVASEPLDKLENPIVRYQQPGFGVPVVSVAEAVAKKPDVAIIGILSEDRAKALSRQIQTLGFDGEIVFLRELYETVDIRSASITRIASRLREQCIPGDIAELGVYKGDTAAQLNALWPDRTLYLFDTFEGFPPEDTKMEQDREYSHAKTGDFADTSVEVVLKKLPYREKAVVRKGYFPHTSAGLENEQFAFVSLDADLYAPTLAGLEFFYPRLSPGGVIVLHDYNNKRFSGVKDAIFQYEEKQGPLALVPLADLHGSCVVIKM